MSVNCTRQTRLPRWTLCDLSKSEVMSSSCYSAQIRRLLVSSSCYFQFHRIVNSSNPQICALPSRSLLIPYSFTFTDAASIQKGTFSRITTAVHYCRDAEQAEFVGASCRFWDEGGSAEHLVYRTSRLRRRMTAAVCVPCHAAVFVLPIMILAWKKSRCFWSCYLSFTCRLNRV